jgi:hypothetical protein
MKKIVFAICWIFLSTNIMVFASQVSIINGSAYLHDESFNSLEINGNVRVHDLVIKENLVGNGSLEGKNVTCVFIKTNGSCIIDGLRAERIESNGSFFRQ